MSRFIRARTAICLLAAAAACATAAPARAHGFGQRYDLALPLSLYLIGAAAAVVFSFLIAGLFLRHPSHRRLYPRLVLAGAGWWVIACPLVVILKLIALVVFGVTVLAGFFGSRDPYQNIAPTMVWIIWWVGLAYVCAFVGNLWAVANPWRTVFEGAEWLYRRFASRRVRSFRLPYPDVLGVWPACILLLTFSSIELVFPNAAVPRDLAWLAVAYSVLTWVGMALYGKDVWISRVEVFSLLFGTFARFAPIDAKVRDHVGGQEREWVLRPFGAGLLDSEPVSTSMMAFVLALLATVLFDGALGTGEWAALEDGVAARLPGLGEAASLVIRTVGIVAFWLIFLGLFTAIGAAMSAAVGGKRSPLQMAQDFALTLVPIAIGYHLAHYLLYLLIQGQYIVPLASDPFGRGWNLFGTAGYRVDIAVLGARFAWYTALTSVVLGHVAAVYLAHTKAMRILDGRAVALRCEVPLTALMVAFTFLSLSLLAEPIVERRAAVDRAAAGSVEIVIPAGAVLPDLGSGRLVAVGPGKFAKEKLTYRVLGSAFHDGTRMTAADILYAYMFAYRWSKSDDTGKAQYDPFVAAATAPLRQRLAGVQVVGLDTTSKSIRFGDITFEHDLLIIDVYAMLAPGDPDQQAAFVPPWSTVPWHVIALMEEAVSRGWAAFSEDEARRRGVEWLDLVRSGPMNARLGTLVEGFARDGFRPEPLQSLVSADEARKRWTALAAFYKDHGHFLVTNGPYRLKSWDAEGVALEAFRDMSYPLGVGSFDVSAIPRRGYVTRVEQKGRRIRLSGDIETLMKFQRSYKLLREPMPTVASNELQRSAPECRYVIIDGQGQVASAGLAHLGADATFEVMLDSELSVGDYTLLAEIIVNGNAMNAEIRQFPLSVQ